MPALDGVEHRYVELGNGVTIHVADSGPATGQAVMLVHGFPQNWWQWHELIPPLAADGYRVLCPDLRGAGWSSAPPSDYRKNDMADDLAGILDRLGVATVTLAGHDWGGPIAFIMMLRHPEKVTGFLGMNTAAPWLRPDLALMRNLWRFWYQIPLFLPVIGPRLIGDPRARLYRLLASWIGGGYLVPEHTVRFYVECMRQPGHAAAASRWYRTFLSVELIAWLRGEYEPKDGARVNVPVRWLCGTKDPVFKKNMLDGYADRISDFQVELVDDVGHWIVEQRPDLVLDRLRAVLREES